MEQKILISDYDDTITKGSGSTFSIICNTVLGKEEYEKMRHLPPSLGKEWFERYINENSLTKEKAEMLWKNFKETELYRRFTSEDNPEISRVLASAENMPSDSVARFYIKDILSPLLAMYNVYIEKLTPEESFFELYERSKAEGDILIINTFKPHEVIIMEFQEYIKLNREKYRAFEEILENQMVFGTIPESCKGDRDRIEFLLKNKAGLLKTPTQEIIVMGDSFADCENFQEAYAINPNSSKFLFVETRLAEEIGSLSSKMAELDGHREELAKAADKLKCLRDELTQINKQIEKTPKNVVKGKYSDIVATIYR